MAVRGPKNGRGGVERCLPLGFWALKQKKFFYPSIPSMIKVDNGGEKKGGKRGETMSFIAATNVIANRPSKRQATGTLNTRANFVPSFYLRDLQCAHL